MKWKFFAILLFVTNMVCAQVGINTNDPKVSLHIQGKPTTTTDKDGLLIPKITGDQLKAKTYSTTEEGTMIYVTTVPSGTNTTNSVQFVDAIGFYYLRNNSGTLRWVKMVATAFDKTDDEWINSGTNVILGKKADGTTARSGHEQVALTDSGRLGLGILAPDSGIHLIANNDGYKDDIKIESYNSIPGANFLFHSGGYANNASTDIAENNTIGQINFHGRIGGNFSTSHARIFSTYKGISGADITLSAGGASNNTLHISETQRVGINTNGPRTNLDINGFIAVHEQIFTVPTNGEATNINITKGQLSITGNRSLPFTLRLGPGINGQRLIIVNNLFCEAFGYPCTSIGAITVVNRDNTLITILNNSIPPGAAKEFIFSNNSWRAL